MDEDRPDQTNDEEMSNYYKNLSMKHFLEDYANFLDNQWYPCTLNEFGEDLSRGLSSR